MGEGPVARCQDEAIHVIGGEVVGRIEPNDVKDAVVLGEESRHRLGRHLDPQPGCPRIIFHDIAGAAIAVDGNHRCGPPTGSL